MGKKENRLCEGIAENIKPQAITLAKAVLALEKKIKEQIPIYREQSLSQEVTTGQGKKMLRQNPTVAEFRATVRDYGAALNTLTQMKETGEEREVVSLDRFKDKIKIAK